MKYPVLVETIEPKTLYVVATPIGNLGDISLRALYILDNVDLILCEDTRRTLALCKYYEIDKPLLSFHSHSSDNKYSQIKELLETKTLALVSDAGTPCISDPGAKLVLDLIEAGFNIRPIPGPSALITALSASGLDTREFTFRGFLGKKGLKAKVKTIMDLEELQVVYESPNRLLELLHIIKEVDSQRQVVVTRELTKLYEEFFRGSANECFNYFSSKEVKGEITLIISGKENNADYLEEEIATLLEDALKNGESLSSACKRLSKEMDIPKNTLYEVGLKLKK
ncbi:MAG: 16S rRNA (cytidine(1402)-2'-O)-methyltransferase [Firmicutes bacterium]|nr:16S rRNA (cytidine(1402)-2'-O)-methyltransferase [Bacillota bacterium]MDD4263983.1 16S rRNA (cytidine(1402)-2'-O)-methyltransferase [Bacillota bacterium]MDD4694188.1 16S rRNA (cytidine(1402)-2'-O)-methyltransferase [Bacillota bacterium]